MADDWAGWWVVQKADLLVVHWAVLRVAEMAVLKAVPSGWRVAGWTAAVKADALVDD